jgi:CheY-like chemotaxis protein
MRVLVVDDDRDIRSSLRMILEDEGYGVVEADDGSDALALLSANDEPFIVVLDNKMKQMDGTLLLQVIAQQPMLALHRAFILVTGVNRPEELAAPYMAQLPMSVVDKPFNLVDFIAAVRQAEESITAPVIATDPPDADALQ